VIIHTIQSNHSDAAPRGRQNASIRMIVGAPQFHCEKYECVAVISQPQHFVAGRDILTTDIERRARPHSGSFAAGADRGQRSIITANSKKLDILRNQFNQGYANRSDVAAQEAALAGAGRGNSAATAQGTGDTARSYFGVLQSGAARDLQTGLKHLLQRACFCLKTSGLSIATIHADYVNFNIRVLIM
jgi:hypothetical protein